MFKFIRNMYNTILFKLMTKKYKEKHFLDSILEIKEKEYQEAIQIFSDHFGNGFSSKALRNKKYIKNMPTIKICNSGPNLNDVERLEKSQGLDFNKIWQEEEYKNYCKNVEKNKNENKNNRKP